MSSHKCVQDKGLWVEKPHGSPAFNEKVTYLCMPWAPRFAAVRETPLETMPDCRTRASGK